MKRFSFVAAAFIFAAIAAVSASAQATTAANAPKIVVINSAAFAGKEGIGKYAKALEALDVELRAGGTEITNMTNQLSTLAADIEKLRKAGTNTAVPEAPASQALQDKVEQGQILQLKLNRAKEDFNQRAEKRSAQVLQPIMAEISKGLEEFAKQKGYALILDAAKLYDQGILLAYDAPKVDVTKEFITFYNARPATTASTAAPPR